MCDRKCNERGFKFHDLAAIVTEEGGTPHSIFRNCCDCMRGNRTRRGQGKQRKLARDDQTKNFSRQVVRRLWGRWFPYNNMWKRFTVKTAWARQRLEEAAKAVLQGSRVEKDGPVEWREKPNRSRADEVTLRGEETGMLRPPRMWETSGWSPPWMGTGMPFVRPFTKASREWNGRSPY